MIERCGENIYMDYVLGIMFIIVLVGMLTDRYVFRPVEKYFQKTRGLAWS
jgi:ABC-type nitrate/sulfonate/bicarbonate transport system permease component